MALTEARQTFTEDVLGPLTAAVDAAYHSDAEPYVALWTDHEPVSLFGALGPCERGGDAVAEALRRVVARFSDGAMTSVFDVVEVGADLAYTVGYETGRVAIDGTFRSTRVRVTHIFRREDGAWRLVHRHGDFDPTYAEP
jgi:ketosteroid isomerase-like protein